MSVNSTFFSLPEVEKRMNHYYDSATQILIDVRSDNVSAPQPSTGDIPSLGSLSERKGMLMFLGVFLP